MCNRLNAEQDAAAEGCARSANLPRINKGLKKHPDNSRPWLQRRFAAQPSDGRICVVQLPHRQQQHFPACQPPKWEQLPHNLFLIDANAGTPVIATTAFFLQYNPKKITRVGSRYSWINYWQDCELCVITECILVMCSYTVCLWF